MSPAEVRDEAAPRPEASARVLLVDDDADLRELLAIALSRDGWETAQAGNAEAGLHLLREGRFDLVITDYELPDKTGGQLLTEAVRERLLGGCAVLVVTGHPDPEDVGAAPVIRKPFDVDALRQQVRRILQQSPRAAAQVPTGAGVELVLYVARGSPASRLAERNVRRILDGSAAGHARLAVRDVAEHPAEAERDRILFVPTLVARCAPPIWMVGSLRNPAALLGVLALCGAGDPARAS